MTREVFEYPVIAVAVLALVVNWGTRRSCAERVVDRWAAVARGPGRIPWMWLILAVVFNVVLPFVVGLAGGVGLEAKSNVGVAATVASSLVCFQLMLILKTAAREELKASMYWVTPLWLVGLVAGMELRF